MRTTQTDHVGATFAAALSASINPTGAQLAARGDDGQNQRLNERLKAARQRALSFYPADGAASHVPAYAPTAQANGALVANSWWQLGLTQLGSWLPLVALVAGFWSINQVQNEYRAQDVSDVDVVMLSSDIPLQAYNDAGFINFLHQRSAQ